MFFFDANLTNFRALSQSLLNHFFLMSFVFLLCFVLLYCKDFLGAVNSMSDRSFLDTCLVILKFHIFEFINLTLELSTIHCIFKINFGFLLKQKNY